jgi:Domain of unknown function (DUF4432)
MLPGRGQPRDGVTAPLRGLTWDHPRRYLVLDALAATADPGDPADRVVSAGFDRTPHMFLYHINVGWPLLDQGTRFEAPIAGTPWRSDSVAEQGVSHLLFPGRRQASWSRSTSTLSLRARTGVPGSGW